MSILTIATSATATNALAVNFSAIAFFHSVGVKTSLIQFINGEAQPVDQTVADLCRLFPNAVRLDDCHSVRDLGGDPATIYVNPSAIIYIRAYTDPTEGATLQVMGGPKSGLIIKQDYHSVIGRF